jgi:hypothetical protein
MGYSFRRYFVARDDLIYRVATAAFDRMLREPARFRMPDLAGQRVRSAEIVVELIDREAVAVVRTSYSVLAFDAAGRLDLGRLFAQQQARVETVLAPVLASPGRDANIIEADARFIAQGGTWTPSKSRARAIDDAALGPRKCPRLRIDNS